MYREASDFRKYWDWKKAQIRSIKEEGMVDISNVSGRLHVACPFNKEFRDFAIAIGGRWRRRTEVWSFHMSQRSGVVEKLIEVYGMDSFR